MKNLILVVIILAINLTYSQTKEEYFTGKKTFCEFQDKKDKKLYKLGIQSMQYKKRLNASTKLFLSIIEKDSTNCDAYFFTGYTLRLQNKFKEATVFYYMADSLSNNKSLIFKQNLATTAAYAGGFELSRKKFKEIIEYFPESPEGYYGIATSSIFIGDFENGLTNINKAILKYKSNKTKISNEVNLTKAILLTKTEKFDESLNYFNQINGKITKDESYLIHYAFSLKKIGKLKNDKKMIKEANKLYNKIKDKSNISQEIKSLFN